MRAPECTVCRTANTFIESRENEIIKFRCMTCKRQYLIMGLQSHFIVDKEYELRKIE